MAVKYLNALLVCFENKSVTYYFLFVCIISNREIKQSNKYNQKKKFSQLMKITQN